MTTAAQPWQLAFRRGRDLLREVGDLVLPSECASCERLGSRWCADCDAALARGLFPNGPRLVRPDPCPPGLPPVWSLGPYAGPLRHALVAYKDADRRDLSAMLAALLASVVAATLDAGCIDGQCVPPHELRRTVALVPVPSSPSSVRRRGDAPLPALTRKACQIGVAALADLLNAVVVEVVPALRLRRRVADQAGLDHEQRAQNLAGAMVVRQSHLWRIQGRACLIVDDVVTTGATLAEAARALQAAGSVPVACSTIAATQRRN